MIDSLKNTASLAKISRLCGFLFFIPIIGLIAGIAAIATGVLALLAIQRNPETVEGKSLASLGIVLGALGILMTLIVYRPLFPVVGDFIAPAGSGRGQLAGSMTDNDRGQKLPSLGLGGSFARLSSSFSRKYRSDQALLKQSWGRDPFALNQALLPARAKDPHEAIPGFTLAGVMLRGGNKVAIINRFFVREGDEIEGAQVLKIENDRVHLQLIEADREITLRMGQ